MAKEKNGKEKLTLSERSRAGRAPFILAGCFLVFSAVMIGVAIGVLGIPAVPVCLIAILETLLAALLRNAIVAIHASVLIVQIAMGFYVDDGSRKGVFMILMCLIYAAALVIITLWRSGDRDPLKAD